MKVISNIILVFIGGGVVSMLRYLISLMIPNSSSGFPLSTFWVNISGCFLIGLFYSFLSVDNQTFKLLLIIGLLGGFTTFSSFGNETIQLIEKGSHQTAFFYVILSNIFGLVAVYLGTKISSIF